MTSKVAQLQNLLHGLLESPKMYLHTKYEGSATICCRVVAKVKVWVVQTDRQTDTHTHTHRGKT